MRQLEHENACLKRLVAGLTIHTHMPAQATRERSATNSASWARTGVNRDGKRGDSVSLRVGPDQSRGAVEGAHGERGRYALRMPIRYLAHERLRFGSH